MLTSEPIFSSKVKMSEEEKELLIDKMIKHLMELGLGKTQRSVSRQIDNLTGETVKDMTYISTPAPKTQTDALELLAKIIGADDPNRDLTRQKVKAELENIEAKTESMQVSEDEESQVAEYIEKLDETLKELNDKEGD